MKYVERLCEALKEALKHDQSFTREQIIQMIFEPSEKEQPK